MTDTITAPDSFANDLRWYMEHLDVDVPTRIHSRGVWSDTERDLPTAGLGSKLGSPKLNAAFEQWLYNGERARTVEKAVVTCTHPFLDEHARAGGAVCTVCAVRDPETGAIIAEAGIVEVERELYRWPMRAALAKVHHVRVPKYRPDLAGVLFQLAVANGNVDRAASTLALTYPAMGDPGTARGHFAFALATVRRLWSEYAPPSPLRAETRRPVAQAA